MQCVFLYRSVSRTRTHERSLTHTLTQASPKLHGEKWFQDLKADLERVRGMAELLDEEEREEEEKAAEKKKKLAEKERCKMGAQQAQRQRKLEKDKEVLRAKQEEERHRKEEEERKKKDAKAENDKRKKAAEEAERQKQLEREKEIQREGGWEKVSGDGRAKKEEKMKEGKAVEQSKKDVKGEEQRHQAMAEKKQEGDAERRKAGKEEACRRAKAAEAEAARRAEDEVLASLLPALSPALVSSSTSGAGAVTGAELDKAQQERAPSPAASAGVAPPSETGASLASGHGRAKAMNRSANQEVQGVAAEALLQGRFFDYQTLHEATRGFAKRLGSGGFGSVFEGTLACGTQVA